MRRRCIARCALSIGFAFAMIACDADPSTGAEPDDSCTAGRVRGCTGANGCEGERSCTGRPGRWGNCRCDDPAPPKPVPDAAAPAATLGAGCANDDDCPAHAFCLTADSRELFGGAPPDGTCVARCDESAADCDRFADAVCVPVHASADQPQALCLERCTTGRSARPKCHAREHVACAPLADASAGAFCRPLCASDEDCSRGLCDPVQGVCVSDAPRDPTFGLRCDPTEDPNGSDPDADLDAGASEPTPNDVSTCTGPCVQLNDAPALCSRRCVFGEATECAPASGGLRRGGCLFVTPGGSIADLGYCGELCDCTSDCAEPTFVCDAFEDPALEASFQRAGVCTDPALVLKRELTCEK